MSALARSLAWVEWARAKCAARGWADGAEVRAARVAFAKHLDAIRQTADAMNDNANDGVER